MWMRTSALGAYADTCGDSGLLELGLRAPLPGVPDGSRSSAAVAAAVCPCGGEMGEGDADGAALTAPSVTVSTALSENWRRWRSPLPGRARAIRPPPPPKPKPALRVVPALGDATPDTGEAPDWLRSRSW